MGEQNLLQGLVMKGLNSALGAAGGKIGGVAASYVLDIFGLGDHEAEETAAALKAISGSVEAIDTKVTALINEVKWNKATEDFDTISATIQTCSADIQTLITKSADPASRDAKVTHYLLTTHPPVDELAPNMRLIHNRMMGGGGLTGIPQPPLMKTLVTTNWDLVRDDDPVETYQNVFGHYARIAETQRLATSLLVAYYKANGQPDLADQAGVELPEHLTMQYQSMLDALPDFVAVAALPHPRVRIDFASWLISPVTADTGNNYLRAGAPHPSSAWALFRVGTPSSHPTYGLELNFPQYGLAFWGQDGDHQVVVDDTQVQIGNQLRDRVVYARAREVAMVSTGPSVPILAFEVQPSSTLPYFRLVAGGGASLGFFDRGQYGNTIELTDTPPAAPDGLAYFVGIVKAPPVESPELSAWSRAFSANAAGEGRFKPGFRVRYRVAAVNRHGDSAYSDWVKADKWNQDAQGYFDGSGTYYMPQIALPNASGRAEAYRIYRQFSGEAEEDVTTGGSFNTDPQSGAPLIFDDFTL